MRKERVLVDGPSKNGQLHHSVEEVLALMWIFACREQGISVRHTLMTLKASATFGQKSFNVRYKSVEHVMGKHKYVYRMRTNKATHRAPQDVVNKTTESMAETHLCFLSALIVIHVGFGTWTRHLFLFRTKV